MDYKHVHVKMRATKGINVDKKVTCYDNVAR